MIELMHIRNRQATTETFDLKVVYEEQQTIFGSVLSGIFSRKKIKLDFTVRSQILLAIQRHSLLKLDGIKSYQYARKHSNFLDSIKSIQENSFNYFNEKRRTDHLINECRYKSKVSISCSRCNWSFILKHFHFTLDSLCILNDQHHLVRETQCLEKTLICNKK